MPSFAYTAKRGPKDIVNGTIEAASSDEAVEKLGLEGLLPIRLEENTGSAIAAALPAKKMAGAPAAEAPAAAKIRFSLGGIRASEITIFTRQLASLIKAGVPILHALGIVTEQCGNPRFKKILEHAKDEIKNGKSLSSVLEEYPKYFPTLYLALIRAGEDSGTLQEALARIADYRQRQEEILSRIRTAMAYPSLMLVTGIGTVLFMLTFVIPRLTGLFSSMGGNLPMPTRILMSVSGVLQNRWGWAGAGIFLLTALILAKKNSIQLKLFWSRVSLKLPLIGGFIIKAELARFSRTLELLIKSGLPILRAIEVTAPVLGNVVLREQFSRTRDELAGGSSLGDSLKQSGVFPIFMTNLVAVGEQSGKLDDALAEIAFFYEKETDEAIKIMTSLMEPLMILVMGLIVGFIVIAMMLPMFELNMMVK